MKKRLLSVLLSCCLLLSLPMAARAAGAGVTYLDITVEGDAPTACAYQELAEGAEGILISGGDSPYALDAGWEGTTLVNNAAVTYAGSGTDWYVFGTGSLNFGGVTVTAGSFTTPYEGADGDALLEFFGGLPDPVQYSYQYTANYELFFLPDAYDVTVAADATLTVKAPPVDPQNPDPDPNGLNVVHSLTVAAGGSLTADDGQILEVRENATVTGLTLYDADGVQEYVLPGAHPTEAFTYNSSTQRWVRQAQGGGDQPAPGPGSEQPVNADPAAAKERIEGRHWAQYGDQATLKGHFVTELWDLLDHEFHGLFADEAAVTAAVSVTGDGTATTGSIIEDLPYYGYSIMLKDNGGAGDVVATGKIYQLKQNQDFILAATKGGNTTYTVESLNTRELPAGSDMSPCIDTAFVIDYDTVTETDGDGRTRAVAKVAFYGIRIEGGTGSTAYSNAFHVSGRNNIGCRVILYKPAFAGAIATANGMEKHAAAWDFGNYPFVCLTGTTQAAPFELTTYFGASSVTLDLPVDDASLALDAITDITTNLPDGAVTIDASTVTFNSGFYDVIPLTVTYADGAASRTGYLTIKRVGIDIQKYGTTHDNQISCTILHGTQNGSTFNWDGDSCAVYATYYYPMESVTQTDRVDLYATYTWANGSVTTRLVSKVAGDDGDSYFLPADDFCLYKGSESAAPTGVAVIAVKSGSTGDKFAGATLGAGAGVAWTA